MTLGEALREQIDQQHKQVALTWLERWREKNPDFERSSSSVVGQFSRCLNNQAIGVRFFFGERARADLLLEIIGVPAEQHEDLWTMAQTMLGAVVSPPAVVVDLTPWAGQQTEATVYGALRARLEGASELGSISLVLTRDQADQIPNGLASLPKITLEVVERADAGSERVLDLAGDATLVVSKTAQDNRALWLAVDVEDGQLVFEPSDGLEVFARDRVLPSPKSVLHSLGAIGFDGDGPEPSVPSSAVARRRLIYELADETSSLCSEIDAEQRAALARALDVDATSTERERLEHELASLEAHVREVVQVDSVELVDHDTLTRQLALRKQRTMPATLLRVGDKFHLLLEKDQAKQALPESAHIEVHEHAPKVVIREFLDELETWGEEDYLRDPYLDRLLERLAPADDTSIVYHHARAFLLSTGSAPAPRAGKPADWRAGLAALLRGRLPAAELLVPVVLVPKNRRYGSRWLAAHDGHRVGHKNPLTSWWQNLPPAVAQMAVGRQHELSTFGAYTHLFQRGHYNSDPWRSSATGAVGLLSLRMLNSDIVRTWQALIDASGLLPDHRDDEIREHERRTLELRDERSVALVVDVTDGNPVVVSEAEWQRSDEHLASLWLALGLAMANPQFIELHDGSVMLSIGGSVLARIRATASPCREPGSTRVMLGGQIEIDGDKGEARLHSQTHRTHEATTSRSTTDRYTTDHYTSHIGVRLPSHVLAFAEGFRLSFEFATSPLLQGSLPESGFVAAASEVSAQIEREEAKARARLEDDDDD